MRQNDFKGVDFGNCEVDYIKLGKGHKQITNRSRKKAMPRAFPNKNIARPVTRIRQGCYWIPAKS